MASEEINGFLLDLTGRKAERKYIGQKMSQNATYRTRRRLGPRKLMWHPFQKVEREHGVLLLGLLVCSSLLLDTLMLLDDTKNLRILEIKMFWYLMEAGLRAVKASLSIQTSKG